jgi:membrane protein YqaA with SNARE-associated domain
MIKYIGAVVGYFLGRGFFGAVIGYFLGSAVDMFMDQGKNTGQGGSTGQRFKTVFEQAQLAVACFYSHKGRWEGKSERARLCQTVFCESLW